VAGDTLKEVSSHFEFGENWQSFASEVTRENIAEATRGLSRLFPAGELNGASFFDIGCGSGLSMLAARNLGAATITGVDIDPNSVYASQALLSRYLPAGGWTTEVKSVFDLDPAQDALHDIVYSWGVLHHTGDLWAAIKKAAALVKPGGYFALALYRKTPFCRFWTVEKRFYTASGPVGRAAIRSIYKSAFFAGLILTGRNPRRHIHRHKSHRGMDWHHDLHDWLGGYPYESVAPGEVAQSLNRLGFSMVRTFEKPASVKGLLGTHCDEFVAVRAR
jgi:SAM-dependent methyltransferase